GSGSGGPRQCHLSGRGVGRRRRRQAYALQRWPVLAWCLATRSAENHRRRGKPAVEGNDHRCAGRHRAAPRTTERERVRMSLAGLDGRVAIVAGGASGIGAATARRLATEGCSVVVGDFNQDGATTTAREITAAGGVAAPVWFDLAEPDSAAALIETTVTEFGGVDLLFNVG